MTTMSMQYDPQYQFDGHVMGRLRQSATRVEYEMVCAELGVAPQSDDELTRDFFLGAEYSRPQWQSFSRAERVLWQAGYCRLRAIARERETAQRESLVRAERYVREHGTAPEGYILSVVDDHEED